MRMTRYFRSASRSPVRCFVVGGATTGALVCGEVDCARARGARIAAAARQANRKSEQVFSGCIEFNLRT
jgi:hypothetical protein